MRKTNTKAGSSVVYTAINSAGLSETERAEAVAAYTLGAVVSDAIAALFHRNAPAKPLLVTARPAFKV